MTPFIPASPELDALQQLDDRAAGHLLADSTHANANVSLIQIHDQRSAPGGVVRFKSILAQLEQRLHLWPKFRKRLLRVPLGLDKPYWVDDDQFDLEYHVRHIALPKPGDWRQFCIQASRLHARALDMDRPPWELYVIEGLDSFLDLPEGSFALLLKTHLAALDLADLGLLTEVLCDTRAKPSKAAPAPSWFADSPPGTAALLQRGMLRSMLAPWQAPWLAGRLLPMARALAGGLTELRPVTRFNSVVSPHRVFETRRFTEQEFETIAASVPGATFEDAVIAVCGGALRQYLDEQGELPEATLNAMVWQAGAGGDAPQGKHASAAESTWQARALATDVADPAARLAAVHARAGAHPPVKQRPVVELSVRGPASGEVTTHCLIRFIPVPQATQYLCGARMSYTSAMLPIRDGAGLAFAVTRYDGRVVISPTGCRELLPDPEHFALCLRDSFQASLAQATAKTKLLPSRRKKAA
ncbi:MAG: wax ester/triacylglycerol synthase family O-acyltransferase [Acidovorax sp.]|uniref:wax ester/triacylglycerol synthase domain-containing protein n=1 Tax=Acidovorax sp. TaxID=1872122 RepID=UPI0039E58F15